MILGRSKGMMKLLIVGNFWLLGELLISNDVCLMNFGLLFLRVSSYLILEKIWTATGIRMSGMSLGNL